MRFSRLNIIFLVTKYRYKVMKRGLAERLRELVRQTCESFEIRIIGGVVSKDHVHILVSAPPNLAPSEIMGRRKSQASSDLFEEFSHGQRSDTGGGIFGLEAISVRPLPQ